MNRTTLIISLVRALFALPSVTSAQSTMPEKEKAADKGKMMQNV